MMNFANRKFYDDKIRPENKQKCSPLKFVPVVIKRYVGESNSFRLQLCLYSWLWFDCALELSVCNHKIINMKRPYGIGMNLLLPISTPNTNNTPNTPNTPNTNTPITPKNRYDVLNHLRNIGIIKLKATETFY
uniref:Uncharacterized protein n=1 Tax=Glossina austeni TaxID=7395 RepID=A0A1A9UF10_GLOAU